MCLIEKVNEAANAFKKDLQELVKKRECKLYSDIWYSGFYSGIIVSLGGVLLIIAILINVLSWIN